MSRDPYIQEYVNYYFRDATTEELLWMKSFMESRDLSGPRWYAFHVSWNLREINSELSRRHE